MGASRQSSRRVARIPRVEARTPEDVDRARAEAEAHGLDVVRVVAADVRLTVHLREQGFERETEVIRMWRVLSGDELPPEWPPGIRVRTFEASDAEAVHALLDEAYAWDRGYAPVPHEA